MIFANVILSLYQRFNRELNHGGSLSSYIMGLCGIQLLRMLKIVLLKRETFSLILAFEKAFSQLKLLIARLIRSTFASL